MLAEAALQGPRADGQLGGSAIEGRAAGGEHGVELEPELPEPGGWLRCRQRPCVVGQDAGEPRVRSRHRQAQVTSRERERSDGAVEVDPAGAEGLGERPVSPRGRERERDPGWCHRLTRPCARPRGENRDGQLGQVSVRLGAFVNAGAQLTALVPQTMWVVANMKETQMADVRLGQPVSFSVDALNHAKLRGHVEQISPATGSEFSVIVPDNATGNFVKIAQRIPVRISIDPNQELAARLRPGMSVVASIDTKAKGKAR